MLKGLLFWNAWEVDLDSKKLWVSAPEIDMGLPSFSKFQMEIIVPSSADKVRKWCWLHEKYYKRIRSFDHLNLLLKNLTIQI